MKGSYRILFYYFILLTILCSLTEVYGCSRRERLDDPSKTPLAPKPPATGSQQGRGIIGGGNITEKTLPKGRGFGRKKGKKYQNISKTKRIGGSRYNFHEIGYNNIDNESGESGDHVVDKNVGLFDEYGNRDDNIRGGGYYKNKDNREEHQHKEKGGAHVHKEKVGGGHTHKENRGGHVNKENAVGHASKNKKEDTKNKFGSSHVPKHKKDHHSHKAHKHDQGRIAVSNPNQSSKSPSPTKTPSTVQISTKPVKPVNDTTPKTSNPNPPKEIKTPIPSTETKTNLTTEITKPLIQNENAHPVTELSSSGPVPNPTLPDTVTPTSSKGRTVAVTERIVPSTKHVTLYPPPVPVTTLSTKRVTLYPSPVPHFTTPSTIRVTLYPEPVPLITPLEKRVTFYPPPVPVATPLTNPMTTHPEFVTLPIISPEVKTKGRAFDQEIGSSAESSIPFESDHERPRFRGFKKTVITIPTQIEESDSMSDSDEEEEDEDYSYESSDDYEDAEDNEYYDDEVSLRRYNTKKYVIPRYKNNKLNGLTSLKITKPDDDY